MSRSDSIRRKPSRSRRKGETPGEELSDSNSPKEVTKRMATVYDAVAGRVGLNGFLSCEQIMSSNTMPSLPEEVLLRRTNAPDQIPFGFYGADEKLDVDQKLPDSDLLKALHAYTSDYFATTSGKYAQIDFRSFDGSALLALGILLEEAALGALDKTGDMALVEPEGLDRGLPESKKVKHQVHGRVKARVVRHIELSSEDSDDIDIEQSPRKRRKAGA